MRAGLREAAVILSALLAACGPSNKDPSDSAITDQPGEDGGPDSGLPDAGGDAGSGPDASIPLPTAEGWTFYGTGNGGPREAWGVSADQGGNIWVAGGEEGLYLLKPGATTLRRFTMDDGLHPYGYPSPKQGTITRTYLNVRSVAGGPAGTVFVGYMGMPVDPNVPNCEDNWDSTRTTPDPNIYKSGDADKVTLVGDGIQVVHYDISTGENVVSNELRGREKVCDIYRIAYDATTASVWFGGNHGYAWGDARYAGNPSCFGQLACSGVAEHAHPLLNGYATDTSTDIYAMTNYYWGLALEPSGGLWVGGMFRSQHCPAGNAGFWTCEGQGSMVAYQIDWWTDPVREYSHPSERVDDWVSGMAIGQDGSVWIGSFFNGLAHQMPGGQVEFITTGLVDPKHVASVATDPADGSIWVGASQGGITRIKNGQFSIYGTSIFEGLAGDSVHDIQVDRSGGKRRILVAFKAGAIGIYEGD